MWLIYVCGALNAIATSLQRPSREALFPRVVKHDDMPAAVALNSVTMQVGPARRTRARRRTGRHGRA